MKYFSQVKFSDRINFVDENNLLVGYEFSSACCEVFGWIIRDENQNEVLSDKDSDEEINLKLKDFVFDKSFDGDKYSLNIKSECCSQFFKMTNGSNDLFLELYNDHNGYYSHGFEFTENDQIIEEGWL